MSRSLLFNALRNSGMLETGATLASSVAAQVPAGVNGLLRLAATGDPDAAAARVEETMDALTYRPRTPEGQSALEGTGRVVGAATKAVANTTAGRSLLQTWDKVATQNPALAAMAVGAINVLDPLKGGGKAAGAAERAVVNIGLKVGDAVELTPAVVKKALEKRGVKVVAHEVRDSHSEPTVIAQLSRPLTSEEAHAVSVELKQDAIAQKVGDTGDLHGPGRAKWGPYNNDFFLDPSPPARAKVEADPRPNRKLRSEISTIQKPQRVAFPGIYKDPRQIAADALAQLAPEDPAMRQLFGVGREDLYRISEGGRRAGTQPPDLKGVAAKPKGAESARRVMVPANEQRLLDVLAEGEQRAPHLTQAMDSWYTMDPVYKRLAELVGPEEAKKRFIDLNSMMGMASPGSDVATEVRRGTGAHWLANQGRFGDFLRYGGDASSPFAPADMRAIPGHPYHSTAQGKPMAKYLQKGFVDMKSPKVPLYIQASGVPETGFQSSYPVGDAHWSRAVGLADARTSKNFGASVRNSEISALGPWWRDKIAGELGVESVPAQARLWGLMGPQTGVTTAIGAPKLEILSQAIMDTAKRLGISPEEARDLVLMGKAHAGFVNPKLLAALGGGGLLALGASKLKKEGDKKVAEINSNNGRRNRNLLEMER